MAPYSEEGAEKGRFKVEYYGSTEVDAEQRAGEETLIDAILQVGGRNGWEKMVVVVVVSRVYN